MEIESEDREKCLADLNTAVSQAILLFKNLDEDFFDGFQTAHQVLSHLVYWHREAVVISQALLLETNPLLKKASLARLNELASAEFQDFSMQELANCLSNLQENLAANLQRLPDWEINFPYKKGCRFATVAERVAALESHINFHTARMQRVKRRGKAWIKAYYLEANN